MRAAGRQAGLGDRLAQGLRLLPPVGGHPRGLIEQVVRPVMQTAGLVDRGVFVPLTESCTPRVAVRFTGDQTATSVTCMRTAWIFSMDRVEYGRCESYAPIIR